MNPNCKTCRGTGWVCEAHPTEAFQHLVDGEDCPGPGDPCVCNTRGELPPGTVIHCEIGTPPKDVH